jgi:hypothetical protein
MSGVASAPRTSLFQQSIQIYLARSLNSALALLSRLETEAIHSERKPSVDTITALIKYLKLAQGTCDADCLSVIDKIESSVLWNLKAWHNEGRKIAHEFSVRSDLLLSSARFTANSIAARNPKPRSSRCVVSRGTSVLYRSVLFVQNDLSGGR